MTARGLSENLWFNLAGFQLVWWLSILYGNQVWPVIATLLMLHLALHRQPVRELITVLVCGGLGYMIDSALTLAGVFQFGPGQGAAPFWLLLLWLGFCATLRQGLRYFSRRYLLAALVGAIAGSLTYLAAGGLGAVQFGLPQPLIGGLLVLLWGLLFPALMRLSDLLEGHPDVADAL